MLTHREMHFHSIVVHTICAALPLSAVALILNLKTGKDAWLYMHNALVIISFLSFVPSVITGFLDREKRYINWVPLFKAKMGISIIQELVLIYQLVMISTSFMGGSIPMLYIILAIPVQLILIGSLTYLGVLTAQGVFGGSTSFKDEETAKTDYDIVKKIKETQPDPEKELPLI